MYVLEKRQMLSSGKTDVTYNEFKTKRAAYKWLTFWDDTMSHLQAKGVIKAYRLRLKEVDDRGIARGESKELKKSEEHQVEDTDCCKVLYDRYVLNWSFEEIARARYTSERQVFRWHGDGLLAVEKILENNKVGSKCQ